MVDPTTPPDGSAIAANGYGTGQCAEKRAWPGPDAVSPRYEEAARMLAVCLLRLAEADDVSGLRWWAARLCLGAGGSAPADGLAEAGDGPRPERVLTPRELEVAVLISQGMTNRRIAVKLRISDYTASTHVRNILGKLGMGRRSQIASWVIRQQLYARLWDTASRIADEVAGGRPDPGASGSVQREAAIYSV